MDRPARGIFICATTWCVYLSAAKHSLLVRFDSSSRDNLANSRPVTAALFTEEPSGMTSKMSYARYTATPLRASCIGVNRSEEHTSELQSHSDLVCRLLLE